MGVVLLTSEKFEAALEAARRDEAPVRVEARRVMYHAAFARYGNDAVQYQEERLFLTEEEAKNYLVNHPHESQYREWGYSKEVRALEIG